jgi:hypothetical protein
MKVVYLLIAALAAFMIIHGLIYGEPPPPAPCLEWRPGLRYTCVRRQHDVPARPDRPAGLADQSPLTHPLQVDLDEPRSLKLVRLCGRCYLHSWPLPC